MDPMCIHDEKVNGIKKEVQDILLKYESIKSMHDFRITEGNDKINIIFDVEVDAYDINTKEKENKLRCDIQKDIKNLDSCMVACKGVDYVLHQAAWGSVPRSIEMPLFYCGNNIQGTLNMLEAARQNKVKKFVYASSSSVYGDEPHLPKSEGKEGNLLSPYAVTKRCDEEWAKQYTRHYGLDTYGMRYFNVFGRRQDPHGAYAAVIPKFIKQLIDNERPIINGDGKQSRDFTYIENVIEANLKACLAPSEVAGDTFNIAYGGREYLIDIYYTLTKALDKEIEPIFSTERKGDIKHSNADISKAKLLLGYEPEYDFVRGLNEAIEWYKNNL